MPRSSSQAAFGHSHEERITPRGGPAGPEISFSTPKRSTGVAERGGISSHAIELSADKYPGHHNNDVMSTQGDVYATAESIPTPMLIRGQVS